MPGFTPSTSACSFFVGSLLALFGCSDWEDPGVVRGAGGTDMGGSGAGGSSCTREPGPSAEMLPTSYPRGLRVDGNRIVDAAGTPLVLRGVNRSGSEYKCIQAGGFFDGPSDEASVRAMASWPINSVRVPLNESCWLGINGAPAPYSGEAYKNAIKSYVAVLHKYALVPILELHWAAPGDEPADRLLPMPNADHSPDLWRDVARTFLDDDGVLLEAFNEPFPDRNRDSDTGWQCWRDGCEVRRTDSSAYDYTAVGMQGLVDAIREVGSSHVILLGGVQYSNSLSRWLEFQPNDPLNNLAAAWHVYDFNSCDDLDCWSAAPAGVAASVPLIATEVGQENCEGAFVTSLMQFLDSIGSGYHAWSWNAFGACSPGNSQGAPWSLITDYSCPTPNSQYAQAFHDHLQMTAR